MPGKGIVQEGQDIHSSGIHPCPDDFLLAKKLSVEYDDKKHSVDDIVYTNYDVIATYPKSNVRREYEISIFDNFFLL